jgi:hypothetical protein
LFKFFEEHVGDLEIGFCDRVVDRGEVVSVGEEAFELGYAPCVAEQLAACVAGCTEDAGVKPAEEQGGAGPDLAGVGAGLAEVDFGGAHGVGLGFEAFAGGEC